MPGQGRSYEFFRLARVTMPPCIGCNEASRESPECQGLEKLVIFGLVRPEKPHEPLGQSVDGGLDPESYCALIGDVHHRGVGLGVKSSPTDDTRHPAVGESLEEGYADSVKPGGQSLSADLTREVSGETTVDQIPLRLDLSFQTAILSRA